jgi:hypothetical protein
MGFQSALDSTVVHGWNYYWKSTHLPELRDEDPDRVREAYGDSIYDRLVDVKTTHDPDNVFHHNQNIRPRLSDELALRAQSSRARRVGETAGS